MRETEFKYPDVAGEVIGVITRIDNDDGTKTFRASAGFPNPRPLYGLDLLAARPDAPVIIFEGEGKTEVAREIFRDFVCTTTPFGARAAPKADLTPLAGRKVIIWPDNNQPGFKYAADLCELLPQARVVSSEGLPDDWDIGDELPEGVTHIDLRSRLVEAKRPATEKAKVVEFPDHNKQRERAAAAAKADKYLRDGSSPTDRLAKATAAAVGKEAPDLSMLDEMGTSEYGCRRAEISEKTGIALKFLDMEYANRRKKMIGEKRSAARGHWEVELWPEEVDADALLRDLVRRIRRHVIMDADAALAAGLWVMFAWVHNAAVHSPILLVRSPEAECGKSTLLGLISFLVPRGMVFVGGTPAVVYRMIEAWHPTLIVDEADDIFRDNPDLRSVINSGWTRGCGVPRCNPETNEPEFFETFGPKAIGIKGRRLPDTTLSRSIVIDMTRKLPGDRCDSFDHTDDKGLSELRQQLARFTHDNIEKLTGANPRQPDGFANRLAANWKALLAIAEICGVGDRAREAAANLAKADDDASLGVELLRDIREIFEQIGRDRIRSEELVNKLVNLADRPWAEMPRNGKPITQLQLANLLKPFKVKPKKVRLDEITLQGYTLEMFKNAFRYIPEARPGETTRNTGTTAENSQKSWNISEANVPGKMAENSQCSCVPGTSTWSPNPTASKRGCCYDGRCPHCRPELHGLPPRRVQP